MRIPAMTRHDLARACNSVACCVAMVLAAAWLPGCESSQGMSSDDAVQTTLPEVQTPQTEEDLRWKASGVVATAIITRVWLPADQTINELWRTASTDSLSGAELRVWHDNQLRAAVVSREQLREMLASLPGHFGVQRQLLTLTRDMVALDPASTAMAHRKVMLSLQGRQVSFAGGRMQLLLGADPQSQGALKLTIVPHQYRPRVTLLPRSHLQAALDGRMFPELMLRALVRPGQVLLLAPDVPLPQVDDTRPPPEAAGETGNPAAGQPPVSSTQPATDPSQVDGTQSDDDSHASRSRTPAIPPVSTQEQPIPFGLGRAVLTGIEGRTTLHQLVMIEATLFSPGLSSSDE